MTGAAPPARDSARGPLSLKPAGSTPLAPLLAVAIALGLLLRVPGLGWGLPKPSRAYPYHPDEPLLAIAALRVDFGALQLSPKFYNYGSLPIYLDRLAVNAAAATGWAHLTPRSRGEVAEMLGDVIRVGRWIAVLMGVLTVWAVGLLGARLYGPWTGALSALLLALAPLHLAQGHYCTVDVPAGLWTTLCLLLCAGALQSPNRGALALAGVCAGLAASTRYNAGVVLVAPLYTLAVTWRRPEWYASDRAAAVIYTPLAAAIAFLLTTPGIVIDWSTFRHDLLFEWQHSETGHGLVFVNTPPAWLFHLTRSLPDGLGLPLTLAVIGGAVWAAARHRPEDGLLLTFVLAFFVVVGGAQIKFARYLVPVLPPLIILAARALVGDEPRMAEVGSRDPRAAGGGWDGGRRGFTARRIAAAGVVLWTGCYGAAMAAVFVRPDPRDQAAEWLRSERRSGERVALGGPPWFYTPPLVPDLGWTHALLQLCDRPPPPDWIIAPDPREEALSAATLKQSRPEFVVVSEYEYDDPLRLKREIGRPDAMTVLMDTLPRGYRLARTFRNRPSLGPLRWFSTGPPVHDLLYPMPDVRLYRRAGP